MTKKKTNIKTLSDIKNNPRKKLLLYIGVFIFFVVIYKFFAWKSEVISIEKDIELKAIKTKVSVVDSSVIGLDKQAAIENKINKTNEKNKKLQDKIEKLKLKNRSINAEMIVMKESIDKIQDDLKKTSSAQEEGSANTDFKLKELEETLKKEIEKEANKQKTYKGIVLPKLNLQKNTPISKPKDARKVKVKVKKPILQEKKPTPVVVKKEPIRYSFFSASVDQNETVIDNMNTILGEKEKEKEKVVPYMIRIGFLEAISMTGVKVPVSSGASSGGVNDSYPVFFKIGEKSIVSNNNKQDLQNCMAIGSARGNGNSERVMIHVVKISCTDSTGKFRYEGDVDSEGVNAYIIGEDSILGMPGVREDVSSSFVYKSFMAAFAQGVAGAFSATPQIIGLNGNQTASNNGSDSAASSFGEGFASGGSSGFQALADYYIDLAKNIMPVIAVKAGRRVTIAIGADVEFSMVPYKSVFVNTPYGYTLNEEQLNAVTKPTIELEEL